MVHNAIKEIGSAEDFLGHLGAADFVLITSGQERAASLQERIRSRLEQSLDYFYPIKDREKTARTKRLVFRLGILESSDGPFDSLDALKLALLRKRQ